MEPDYDETYGMHQDDHYCVHGSYVGGWAGPDYMCGLCEDGCFTLVQAWEYSVSFSTDTEHEFLTETSSTFEGLMSVAGWWIKIANKYLDEGIRFHIRKYQRYLWIPSEDDSIPGDTVIGTFYSRHDLQEYQDSMGE